MLTSIAQDSAERNPATTDSIPLDNLLHALQHGDNCLALYVTMHGMAQDGTCRASLTDLQQELRISKNTVRKHLNTLIEEGLIDLVSKGDSPRNPSVFAMEGTVSTPDNIRFLHPQTVSTPNKVNATTVSNPLPPPPKRHQKLYQRQQNNCINDSINPPLQPPSGKTRENTHSTTVTRGTGVVSEQSTAAGVHYLASETLFAHPAVQRIQRKYHLTTALVFRSLADVQREWKKTGLPKTTDEGARRAAKWLTRGEEDGRHGRWRQEDPYGMAGIVPK